MGEYRPSELYPGYLAKTTRYDNCTVNVHWPVLTEEEQEKRMKAIKEATARVFLAVAKQEAEEKKRTEERRS